ncbi:hypothetical protein N9N67_12325, partial [Bacteriovoracaceae bacterium]|nr:hypothetical protein [Bacteriovoracaceae bacterium]
NVHAQLDISAEKGNEPSQITGSVGSGNTNPFIQNENKPAEFDITGSHEYGQLEKPSIIGDVGVNGTEGSKIIFETGSDNSGNQEILISKFMKTLRYTKLTDEQMEIDTRNGSIHGGRENKSESIEFFSESERDGDTIIGVKFHKSIGG